MCVQDISQLILDVQEPRDTFATKLDDSNQNTKLQLLR
jgi:hypothetical protein